MSIVDNQRTVFFVSQEGESFYVPSSVANISQLVETMINNNHQSEEVLNIPLPKVQSSILAKVIEFGQHYEIEPMCEIEKVCWFAAVNCPT